MGLVRRTVCAYSIQKRDVLSALLEIVMRRGWEIARIDESRAFLSSAHKGQPPTVASVRGVKGGKVHQVSGALCGLKTSPRDSHEEVVERLTAMGFVRDSMRSVCLFTRGARPRSWSVGWGLKTGRLPPQLSRSGIRRVESLGS
jgi:hypothetical protein